MLVAIALARAVTLVSVMRIRAAGFEMLWSGAARVVRMQPGGTVELEAEVRNRDNLAARYDKLRVVASPAVQTWIEPVAGQVHATGSVRIKIRVRALRVGYHGIYGLALEVRGAPGLFEVPLTFANPFGVEVLPRALARPLTTAHGGRSRTLAMAGRAGNQRGDGTDLRELREHLPGDPFRRIAWKASARRGKLVVKEFEREERDVVVVVLDASVELWAGPMGGAPLDRAVDLCATLCTHHLGRGDLVGLKIVGARMLASVAPGKGRAQLNRITLALMDHAGVLDADRCGWDESDLALQVTEHMRPLDPKAIRDLQRRRWDRLVRRASVVRKGAPFNRPAPYGRNATDSRLRRYAACFGIHAPARLEPDGPRTAVAMGEAMREIAKQKKPRASIVHVVGPPPTESGLETIRRTARGLRSSRVALRWTPPPVALVRIGELMKQPSPRQDAEPPLGPTLGDPKAQSLDESMIDVVENAVLVRARTATRCGEARLRRAGFKVVRITRDGDVIPPRRSVVSRDEDGTASNTHDEVA